MFAVRSLGALARAGMAERVCGKCVRVHTRGVIELRFCQHVLFLDVREEMKFVAWVGLLPCARGREQGSHAAPNTYIPSAMCVTPGPRDRKRGRQAGIDNPIR